MKRLICMLLCGFGLHFGPFALAEEAPAAIHMLTDEAEKPALAQDDLLEVHLLNVEFADCILLRMGGKTLMVDAGNLSTGEDVVAYLANIGVDALDVAFMSHFHTDHIAGYLTVIAEMPVREVWLPAGYEDFHSVVYDELMALITEKEILVRYICNEETEAFGKATLAFYQWDDARATVNNRSMIVRASYGNRAILLAADVENKGQKALAEAYGEALEADILKMPHHGLAAYMREFHAAVQPALATFSNTKNHIANTIRLTEQRHVAWLLTTKGTVVAVTDGGENWQVWQETE